MANDPLRTMRTMPLFFRFTRFPLLLLMCILFLFGCTPTTPNETDVNPSTGANTPTSATILHQEISPSVPHIEPTPEAFQHIIEKDLFQNAVAFRDRLLNTEVCSEDKENRTKVHRVWMLDLHGNTLAEHTCSSKDAYYIRTLIATKDGGFLFVLGFSDRSYGVGSWASDEGVVSRVIKCDCNGALQFDTPFYNVECSGLAYCFERDGQYFFFGTNETPETRTTGVYSPTDIYMAVLDKSGNILNTHCIGGSDFDSLDGAEMENGNFVLSISAQSEDGDFTGSGSKGYPKDWVFTVNDSFEIISKEKKSGRDYFNKRIGEKNGIPVYPQDAFLKDFDAGSPTTYIDYGDFYLIVSQNITGIYEKTPPTISAIWHYTETVYSAYDQSGKLLFRDSVDSSPDFDAMLSAFMAE